MAKSRRILAVFAAIHVLIFIGFLLDWKFLDTNRTDVDLYLQYGYRIWTGKLPFLGFLRDYPAYGMWLGHIPYRDFLIEYPPLSVIPFALPALLPVAFPGGFGSMLELYRNTFWLQILILDELGLGLVYLVCRRLGPAEEFWKPLAAYTLALATLGTIIAQRYDIIPALLTLLCLYAFARGRSKLVGISLALGVAVKLYPIVIAPILIIAYWRRKAYRDLAWALATFGLTMVLVLLPFISLSGGEMVKSLTYQGERGLQVESFYAVPYEIAGVMDLFPVRPSFNHQAVHIDAPGADQLASLAFVVLAGVLLLVYITYFKRTRPSEEDDDFEGTTFRFAFLAVLGFIIANKVLSPQFLIWLLPLLPLLDRGRAWRAWGIFIGAAALTLYVFPHSYAEFLNLQPLPVIALFGRNSLLALLFVLLLRPDAKRVLAFEHKLFPTSLFSRGRVVPQTALGFNAEKSSARRSYTVPSENERLPDEVVIGDHQPSLWPD